MHSYETSRLMMLEEGEVVIPILLDLTIQSKVCDMSSTLTYLSDMFEGNHAVRPSQPQSMKVPAFGTRETTTVANKSETTKRSVRSTTTKRVKPYSLIQSIIDARVRERVDKVNKRPKRFVATLALGISLVSAIWGGISQASVNKGLSQLRDRVKDDNTRIYRAIVEGHKNNQANFIAISKALKAFNHTQCKRDTFLNDLILKHYAMQEFDDIISSINTQRLTTHIIPNDYLNELVSQIPELAHTVYQQMPYMLYYASKILFDLSSFSNSALKGVLIIPIIRKYETVEMHYMTRVVDDTIKAYGPEYVTKNSKRSISSCDSFVEIAICKPHQLKDPVYPIIEEPFKANDGLVFVNVGILANIASAGSNLDTQVLGPVICSRNDTSSVSVNGYVLYTHSATAVILQPSTVLESVDFRYEVMDENYALMQFKDHMEKMDKEQWYMGRFALLTIVVVLLLLLLGLFIWHVYGKIKGYVQNTRTNINEVRKNSRRMKELHDPAPPYFDDDRLSRLP